MKVKRGVVEDYEFVNNLGDNSQYQTMRGHSNYRILIFGLEKFTKMQINLLF